MPHLRPVELAGSRLLAIVLAVGTLVEGALLFSKGKPTPTIAIVILSLLGPLLLLPLGRWRMLLLAPAIAAFLYGGVFAINLMDPQIDVLDWQQQTSEALLEGHPNSRFPLVLSYRVLSYPFGVGLNQRAARVSSTEITWNAGLRPCFGIDGFRPALT